jgi:hypothetical protein
MILPKNSYLRNPPSIISPKQVLTFNALRYSIDICEISKNRLAENLFKINTAQSIEPLDFPTIFLDVWSIINHCVIFKKIIVREFNINGNEPNLEEINKAKNLRDSNQHIDERISEPLLSNDLPAYGLISWRTIGINENEVDVSTIYSGTFTSKRKIKMTIRNPEFETDSSNAHMIEFTSIIREKENGNWIFKEQNILIDKIIYDLKSYIELFDKQINEQLSNHKNKETHKSDLIVQMTGIRMI